MDGMANLRECPDCAGTNIVYIEARDQLVCRDCGLVFEPLLPDVEEKFEKTHNLKLGIDMPKSKGAMKKAPARASKPAKSSKPAKKAPAKKASKPVKKGKKR